MLINEAGLVRAIKRAYKTDGYIVGVQDGNVSIYSYGKRWCIQTSREALPRKVLAAVVEHAGMIPDEKPVYIVRDDEPQLVMAETASTDLEYWRSGSRGDNVDMVPVIMQGYQIFQSAKSGVGACWGIPLYCLDMIERKEAEHSCAAVVDDNCLLWTDGISSIAIEAVRKATSSWAKEWERAVWQAMEGVDLHKEEE